MTTGVSFSCVHVARAAGLRCVNDLECNRLIHCPYRGYCNDGYCVCGRRKGVEQQASTIEVNN
jgi:hypothetical protein